ncbi:Bis(5'-nucleosyl)-tetraphosphatase, symmetrical [Aquicella siphonis]|uniref:Bis(5'-nucleosyl)-tetraphosphatase, symmetrical n=1 Tax=Aquicella siphonis TaxID=254247 RepID=A0A5E4PKC8_9COXI|nr:symmetrical bis(5'-nucleosyl)-tetraphosphatase [Aquicella siphonis]VVC76851.1 Bis(5'-nucleosyl)-tetraphosphatase, symmetrical [Aquicella siphonis]
MTIYAIGDIQGCFAELEKLLAEIRFNPQTDSLWFTGDLVNRGPDSLKVLRWIKALGEAQVAVLGNHDLHLLAVAYGVRSQHRGDTLDEILRAPDKIELIEWLRHRPLLHFDRAAGFVVTHAGLAPCWSLKLARELAHEAETALRGAAPEIFLKQMYGDLPDKWSDDLSGADRYRCIINYFTRMRFCYPDGRLDLSYKGEIAGKPRELLPWFEVPDRVNAGVKILFGHWAALNGNTSVPGLYALDTGCVWGNCLTALRLEDEKRFSVRCA